MANGKSILVDVSRCTGCRGCQVACKQWNGLPAEATKQTGTYQNPPDMSASTWKVVRFHEGKDANGKVYWNFFSDMCRHCVEPPCLVASEDNSMLHDEATGAVVYTDKTKNDDFALALDACPYHIPRKHESGRIFKCTMCIDRQRTGKIPACVFSCPTGAMQFGDRDAILQEVDKRVATLKKTYPKAQAIDKEDVRVIYIITDDPANYAKHVKA